MADSFVIDRDGLPNRSHPMESRFLSQNGTMQDPSAATEVDSSKNGNGTGGGDLFDLGSSPVSSAAARIPKKKRMEESEEENQDDIFLIDDGDDVSNEISRRHPNNIREEQQQPPDQGYDDDDDDEAHASATAAAANSSTVGASASMAGHRFSGSGELKLPEGVKLPPTITPELLSERLREMLFQLPVDFMKDAFTEYDTAVTLKGDTIRSHQAYLHGVLKRYVQLIEKERESKANTAMGKDFTPEVKVSNYPL